MAGSRRKLAPLCAALVAALLAPAVAHADQKIVAASPFRFTTPSVTMDQGERLTFENQDNTVPHNVTHRPERQGDPPLFKTDSISGGQEVFVEGSQYLTSGGYDFICTLHSGMEGRLTVTTAGTPVPRPAPDQTAPRVGVQVLDRRKRPVRRAGALRVRVSTDEAAQIALTARAGSARQPVVIGRASATFAAASRRTLLVELNRAGRQAVARKGRPRIAVTAVARDPAGNRGEGTVVRRLTD